jgi:hypothetical protein
VSQEELYIEGAPYIYFQSANANPRYNPDADGYYWGMTGTAANPVYNIGCIQDVSLTEDVTLNSVRCDTVGDKDAIQKRNHLEVNLTILSQCPLAVLAQIMNLSTPLLVGKVEKVGIGAINNAKSWMVYMPKVYDEDTGDYILIHLHRAKFVDAWTIDMRQGEPWQLTGKLWAFADDNKPAAAKFGTIIRADVSAL